MSFLRPTAVPDAVKAVALDTGERRVAWALTPDGAPVVATNRGLRLPGSEVLGWDGIERAHWAKPVLEITELTEHAGSGRRHEVTLDLEHDTDLPEEVRARVSASIAWSSHVKLRPTGGVRIIGRRRPGAEVLAWQLVFDRDSDPTDPSLRAQADEHVAAARRTIG